MPFNNSVVAFICLFLAGYFCAQSAYADPLTIKAERIDAFDPVDLSSTTFGRLEFLGGLVLTSDHEDFGGISAMRFDERRLVALTDKARVITGEFGRAENGALTSIGDARITRIKRANGKTITGADDKDSESLVLLPGGAAVGYERNNRVVFMEWDKRKLRMKPENSTVDLNGYALPYNKGLEALSLDPISGNLVGFAEHALNENRNHRGFVIGNGKVLRELELTYKGGYSVTDAQFMSNGDLVILERYYTPFIGVYMRIRLVSAEVVAGDVPLDGEVLVEVSGRYEIDNMEALALSDQPDGSTIITLVSDNNFSKRQRTVLLDFRLNSKVD